MSVSSARHTRGRETVDRGSRVTLPTITSESRAALVRYLQRRTSDRATAEDLAHETLVRYLASTPATPLREPQAFLRRIANNLLISDWRRARTAPHEPLSDKLITDDADPEHQAIASSEVARLRRILDSMPAKRREVLMRRRLHGESYEEISQHMGLSLAAIEKHMTRALLTLRTSMRGDT